MNKRTIALLSCALIASPAMAEESMGEKLVNDHCQRCHDNSIFTRSNSIIHSYGDLQRRVEFCDANAGTHWNAKQFQEVVEYLNNTFYKFPK